MKLRGIKFAPLNTPLERRLQTLGVVAFAAFILISSPLNYLIMIGLLYHTGAAKYFVIPYLIWLYYDRETCDTGGRRGYWIRWLRNLSWWHYIASYFPLKLVKTVDLDPSRNYLLCSFPHGILCTGAFIAFSTYALDVETLFPGLEFRTVILKDHFYKLFTRDFLLNLGLCSSSERNINYLLSNTEVKTATLLSVGGSKESLECKPGNYTIHIKNRRGFIRLALKNGTPLVPVVSFGETDIFDQVDNPEGSILRKFQEFIKDLIGIPPLLVLGRGIFQYSFGILPHRKPVTVVVGSPMEVPKIPEPTQEQVDEYHTNFIKHLVNHFEEYKYKYVKDPENTNLNLK